MTLKLKGLKLKGMAMGRFCIAWVVLGSLALGCRQDMQDQPRIEALEANDFFPDGMGSRGIPAGTVPRGQLRDDTRLYEGRDEAGELIARLPLEVTPDLVLRGQNRYEIFCSVCHDSTGGGQGMIVRRGFKEPPPLFEARLAAMPDGHFFDVMSRGFGVMSSYAKQISVEDRWAIVAYIRALQLSQNSQLADLPAALQEAFHTALTAQAETSETQHEGSHH